MANEYICSQYGKDGTRCGCKCSYTFKDLDKEREAIIRENEAIIAHNLFLLSRLNN